MNKAIVIFVMFLIAVSPVSSDSGKCVMDVFAATAIMRTIGPASASAYASSFSTEIRKCGVSISAAKTAAAAMDPNNTETESQRQNILFLQEVARLAN